LPVGVFVWDIEYTGPLDNVEGSLTFTWTSNKGDLKNVEKFDHETSNGVVSGLEFKAKKATGTGFAIAVQHGGRDKKSGDDAAATVALSFVRFDEGGDGGEVWSSLSEGGTLPLNWKEAVPARAREYGIRNEPPCPFPCFTFYSIKLT
jgi:hypothetical protein